MQRSLLALGLFALVVLTGCPSLSTMQTASTVPKGQVRFAVGLEGVGYAEADGSVTVPQTELGVRYGVNDEIDFGAKLYFLGMEVGGKYQFMRGELDAAIAPAVSYISVNASAGDSDASFKVAYIHLPLLFGYNVNDRLTLGGGPKFLYVISTSSGSNSDNQSSVTSDGSMVGGYGQLAYRLGDAFWVAPEINVYKPFTEGSSGFVFQGGLVFMFGGGPQNAQPMGGPPGAMPPPM